MRPFTSLLSRWTNSPATDRRTIGRPRAAETRAASNRRRPLLEPLEERTLLTTAVYYVNTFLDTLASDKGQLSLRRAILLAESQPATSAQIHLPPGTYPLSLGELDITGMINGLVIYRELPNGPTAPAGGTDLATIDAQGNSRVFNLDSDLNGVDLFDLDIRNGNAATGGGISYKNVPSLRIQDCTFEDNTAAFGGALYNYGTPSSSMVIFNCIFLNNSADHGGVLYDDTLAKSTYDFEYNTLSGNKALDDSGGALFLGNNTTTTILDCTFSDNSSFLTGGAIQNAGQITMQDSELLNNSAFAGGAVENEASGNMDVQGSDFTTNMAISGAGIDNRGMVNLYLSTLTGNTAAQSGGGIYNGGTGIVLLSGGALTNNTAGLTGGGIYNTNTGLVRLSGVGVLRNTATQFGGGVFNTDHGLVGFVNSCQVLGNQAFDGGGVYNEYLGAVFIDSCTFNGNSSVFGGGLFNSSLSAVVILSSTFSNNSATSLGGAVYNILDTNLTILDNSFLTNHAGVSGGGVYSRQAGKLPALAKTNLFQGNTPNDLDVM